MVHDFYFREELYMIQLRGAISIAALAVVLLFVLVPLPIGIISAQTSSTIEVIDVRGKENRQRIEKIEEKATDTSDRLIRIETQLDLSRRQSEWNGQLLAGVIVGIVGIIFERVVFYFGVFRRREQES